MSSLELLERSRPNSEVDHGIGFELEAVVQANAAAKASDFLLNEETEEVSDHTKMRPKQDGSHVANAIHQQKLDDAMKRIRECFRTRGDLLYNISVHLLHHDGGKSESNKKHGDHNESKEQKRKQHVVVVAFRQSVISYFIHFLRMEV